MAQYLNALVSYQDDVKNIQDNYRNQMDLYQVMADVYKSQMTKYQEDLAKYDVARISAVNTAEGTIQGIIRIPTVGLLWTRKTRRSISPGCSRHGLPSS